MQYIYIFLNIFFHIGLVLHSHIGQHAQNLYLKCTFNDSQLMQIQNMQQVHVSHKYYIYKNLDAFVFQFWMLKAIFT
jgi:hypothetical protein